MGASIDNLSLKEFVAENSAERAFSTTPATVTMSDTIVPAAADANAKAWRFVRVQAHDGDLILEIGYADNASMRAGTPNSGSRRVRNGTETFQLPAGGLKPEIQIAAVTGTVHGAVQWGR